MEVLLDNSKGGMMYPVFVVVLGTVMRISEILRLTWDCIDFDKRSSDARKYIDSYEKMQYIKKTHKKYFAEEKPKYHVMGENQPFPLQ